MTAALARHRRPVADALHPSKRRRESDHALPSPRPMTRSANHPSLPSSSASSSGSSSGSASASTVKASLPRGVSPLSLTVHFFVRTTASRTLVFHGWRHETIGGVLSRLADAGCGRDLRLIYCGRQLSSERTLASLHLPPDSTFHLVSRLRSTPHPRAWQLASHIAATATAAAASATATGAFSLDELVKEFLTDASSARPKPNTATDAPASVADAITTRSSDHVSDYLDIFLLAGAAVALVRLYLSKSSFYRSYAERAIRCFILPDPAHLPKDAHLKAVPVLAELCRLLGAVAGKKDALYVLCRGTLASLLSSPDWKPSPAQLQSPGRVIELVLPFAREMADVVMEGLASLTMGVPSRDVEEFSRFLIALRRDARAWMRCNGPMPKEFYNGECEHNNTWIRDMHAMFMDLLKRVDECLKRFEMDLSLLSEHKGIVDSESRWAARSHILAVLTELDSISDIYVDVGHNLRFVLLAHKAPLNALVRCAKRNENLHWLMKHKDLLWYEARRNFVLMMFPEGKDDYGDLHEMLIDRMQLLSDSFTYITQASASELRSGLFMEFKNEEATGPGVLREWFCMVCHALFSPEHVLFLPCPNDRRRFYLNPTSAVDPLHLKYFIFSGRIIGLALMHKVQVGIVFDRILFSQLAGRSITLEDIADADPFLYASCKKILEMDADLLDSDTLGLTFVREVEELGSRKVIELCPGGKDKAVNSMNRGMYIKLLIHDCFVNSISVQLTHFARGFSDILVDSNLRESFFQSLDIEDFDRMLGGNGSLINVNDWKSHTEYNGYKEKDRQINWFWKAVERMPIEQQRRLLFFWTSVKYLPTDGFGGLGSKLYIYRTSDSHDHLPSSHTCFYRLCLPPYTSSSMMQSRLQMITQEHVSCSFGTW